MTEDEIVGWYHSLNGHEFEQALGDGEGQGSLACCSPWGPRESDTTERLQNSSSLKGFTKLWIIKPELWRFPKLKSYCEELSQLCFFFFPHALPCF